MGNRWKHLLLVAIPSFLLVLLTILINITTGATRPRLLADHLTSSWVLLGVVTAISALIAVQTHLAGRDSSEGHAGPTLDAALREITKDARSASTASTARLTTGSDLPRGASTFVGRKSDTTASRNY